MKRTVAAVVLGIGAGLMVLALGCRVADAGPERRNAGRARPYNLVVVVLDTSESFQRPSRQPGVSGKVLAHEALRVVQRFIEEAAGQRRRRTDGQDQYALVAADAASQLIWSGSREQLATLTPDVLASKLSVRRQFASCTDLEGALREAAAVLGAHPDAAEKYVLTFSDLLHEPPSGSYTSCVPVSGAPPAGIPWDELAGARLGFYFVSKDFPHRPDQKWRAELERRGIAAKFLDAAQALTADVALTPPPSARRRVTEEEVRKAGAQFETAVSGVWSALWYAAWAVGLGTALMAGGIAVGRWRARRPRGSAA